jgi:hypothetical protein
LRNEILFPEGGFDLMLNAEQPYSRGGRKHAYESAER